MRDELADIARISGCTVHVEKHIESGDERKRSDGRIVSGRLAVHFDVAMVHTSSPGFENQTANLLQHWAQAKKAAYKEVLPAGKRSLCRL